jgi:hypothetical protein
MNAILSRSCRAVLLGALLVTMSPTAAGNNWAVHIQGGKRNLVLQVRGGS